MRLHLQIIVLVTLLLTSCSSEGDTPQEQQPAAIDTIPMLVIQIQKCARLYTTEYHIHKIVTHDDVLKLKGNLLKQNIDITLPLGERKVAIPMDATLKAYIDFANFTEHHIERNGDKITILLPDPQVVLTSSKINQNEIREYVGLTRSHFTDKELSAYEQQGRQAILNSVPRLGIKQQAQENAARVLVPMLTEMGYKEENVTIAFRKNLDIMSLINSNLERK
ncbi:MAG: DUF4230 domain-containing protein [Prevotella sp.]|nr:DUF4230 domain-containing protein [Prevotella sp.]